MLVMWVLSVKEGEQRGELGGFESGRRSRS